MQRIKVRNRPVPVLIVSILFFLSGCLGLAYHAKELFDPNVKLHESVLVLLVRLLAVVCGVLLFLGVNWSRWLAIAWLLYHVVLSALHTTTEMIMHIALLVIVAVLLYLPVSNGYYNKELKK